MVSDTLEACKLELQWALEFGHNLLRYPYGAETNHGKTIRTPVNNGRLLSHSRARVTPFSPGQNVGRFQLHYKLNRQLRTLPPLILEGQDRQDPSIQALEPCLGFSLPNSFSRGSSEPPPVTTPDLGFVRNRPEDFSSSSPALPI